MDTIVISVVLAVVGLAMGSFAGASVWRLRASQLREDKAAGETVDSKEYKTLKPLREANFANDRSVCLHCHHQLKWYDLIPLASWLSTGGKCRYCKKPIGWFEPLMELGVAALFVASFLLWPENLLTPGQILHFALWLVAGVMLAILFAYDLKWFLLPDKVMYPLIGVGVIAAITAVVGSHDMLGTAVSTLIGVMLLSGLYLILWIVSRGQWIGFGDVKLGLALALLLADWKLAFLALFAANLIGCLIVIPGMLTGKLTRKTRVPFGPLLILGAIVAVLWGNMTLTWYFSMFL